MSQSVPVRRRTLRILSSLLSTFVWAAACGDHPSESGTDGITHWLTCTEPSACNAPDTCACGVCMPECRVDADCLAVGATARCMSGTMLGAGRACQPLAASSVCVPGCVSDAECKSVSPDWVCGATSARVCLPPAASSVAGAGGTPGQGGGLGAGGTPGQGGGPTAGGGTPTAGAATTGVGGSSAGMSSDSGAAGQSTEAGAPTVLADRWFEVPVAKDCYAHTPSSPPPGEVCGQALCGNQHIDSCEISSVTCQVGVCPPLMGKEECDAGELEQRSCASLGFAHGELSCSDTCLLDWSGCGACGTDPHIEDCLRLDGLYYVSTTQDFGVASNGQQAALVWAEHSNVSDALGRYHFALVNDDLTLSASACFGDENSNFTPVLSPLPSGWLLAGGVVQDGVSKVSLTVFDAAGAIVSTPSPTLLGAPLHLIARPDGGPLLLYSVSDASGTPTQMVALLDAQGQPLWTATMGGARSVIDALAVYTGDGFLWTSVDNLSTSSQVVARIDMTGQVTQTSLSLPETDFYADLTWTGQEARLFWNNYSLRLDKNGAALGPVQQLLSVEASQPRVASSAGKLGALVRVGRTEGTLGGFIGSTSTGHPELVIVDAQGAASAPFPVFQDGNQGPNFQHHLVTVGDRWLAAGVTRDSRLGIRAYLAWIRP